MCGEMMKWFGRKVLKSVFAKFWWCGSSELDIVGDDDVGCIGEEDWMCERVLWVIGVVGWFWFCEQVWVEEDWVALLCPKSWVNEIL